MQVFVLGMHRSGTSLLSRVLHELGLFVGEPEELMPAQPCNVEGFWERIDVSELNETLLELAGGSWDCPPSPRALAGAWRRAASTEFEGAMEKARAIVARLHREGGWSVKDPRTSFTWPLWKGLVPAPRVVVALRDPFEVAASLVARHGCTETLGLTLWRAYNEAILRCTAPEERTVVAYHSLLADPRREVRRLADGLGLSLTPARLDAASRVASAQLRTHCSSRTARRLARPRHSALRQLYRSLLAEAGEDASRALDPAPWPVGQDVDVATAADTFDALARGWSTPEPQGAWSSAAQASIALGPLRVGRRNAPMRVRLTVLPFVAAACSQQVVRVACSGEVVLEAVLREPRVQVLEFSVTHRAQTEHLTLDLLLPNASSPAHVGSGPDLRSLGVLLSSLRIDRVRALPSSRRSSVRKSG